MALDYGAMRGKHHGKGGICGIQVSKVEQDIDNFLENFRRKSSTLDEPLSDVRRETLGLPPVPYACSSSQCSTDEGMDDSPDRSYYLGGGVGVGVRTHKRQISNTTTDSEWGPDYDEECMREKILREKEESEARKNKAAEGIVQYIAIEQMIFIRQRF